MAKKGRVVLNHSTHLAGLIPILERLTQVNGITTITPGVISRARSHAPQLRLRVSVPTQGGFKVIARQGKTVQEVFVVTSLEKAQFDQVLAQVLVR